MILPNTNRAVAPSRTFGLSVFCAWTALVLGALVFSLYQQHRNTINQASIEAKTHLDLIIGYRTFIADLGGVYATTQRVAPNPYLKASNRDVLTGEGDSLTLINPAYMTRLIFESMKNHSGLPIINKLTSLKHLNPVNAPDAWERQSLLSFEKGRKEAREVKTINGEPYLRLMQPFVTDSTCLACHGAQGYKEGDVRGGISISVPLNSYYASEARTRNNLIMTNFLVWLAGCAGLFGFTRIRQKQERDIIEQRNFSANLIRNSATATFVLDKSHRIMLWNRACEALTGRRESEMIGTDNQWQPFYSQKRPTVADLLIDNDLDSLPRLYGKHSRSPLIPRGVQAEGWFNNLGGKSRYITFEAAPIFNQKGELIAAIESLQDVTEGKRLEEQLAQSRKLESIGRLAGGVSHDFNNILSAIIGFAHISLLKLPADDPVRGNIEQILRASERASALTQDLLSFSRKRVASLNPLNLNDLVKRVEKFLLRLIREDIEITTLCAEGDLTVLADGGQLDQVLMNLVTNARDAMPEGGRITVRTGSAYMDEASIEQQGHGKSGRYAFLLVSDTGEGMDAKTREMIFEPFFTTKESGKGTGLGLAMVYGIVKHHNGFIDVESEPGMGTTFRIYLPLIRGSAEEEQCEENTCIVRGGSETVLLAEDDAALRGLVSTMLADYGYRVIEAADGADAVAKFLEHQDQVRLLILDGIMPRMNGKEAYDEIRALNPSIKALFVSGYSDDILSKQGLLDPDVHFLLKPLDPSTLLRTIRDVLDAATAPASPPPA
jgi:PAS domain S-box-containing protein